VLIFEIVVNVPGGGDVGGSVVVFDVVGGKAGVAVDHDDVAVGDIEVALAALWTAGGDFGKLAFAAGQVCLLRTSSSWRRREKKQNCVEE